MKRALILALALSLVATPASAQFVSSPWKLVASGTERKVADSGLTVTASGDWNRSTRDPHKRQEIWTRDGGSLDELDFFVIPKGKPLFKERHKKRAPLPKFDPAMLPTDIAEWFEQSARIALGSALFEVTEVRPATLAGTAGVQFSYRYTSESDNLERLGEARAAVIGGKLYLINFDAAKIHYFDEHIAEVRSLMDSARIVAKK